MNIVPISQLDANNPGTWPIYYKVISWILIAVVVVFGYAYFVRTPLLETRDSLISEEEKVRNEYRKLYSDTLNLNKYLERNRELLALLQNKLKYLPPKEQVPELIESIHDAAVANEIKFDRIFPSKVTKEKYYDINPIILSTTTSYSNFAKFAQDIAALEKILNVSNVKIEARDSYNPLQINSTLQTYVYNFNLDALSTEVGGKK